MTTLQDLELKGVSNCCSAKVYEPGTCSDCKEPCEAVDEEDEISPKDDALGGSTDLEGALEKILFTPKPTLYHNLCCSGPCGRKKKFPTDVAEVKCPDCPGTYR